MLFNRPRAIDYMQQGEVDVFIATPPVNIPYFSNVDFGCRYGGYFSDSGTTLAMCELSEVLHQRFAAIRASIASDIRKRTQSLVRL